MCDACAAGAAGAPPPPADATAAAIAAVSALRAWPTAERRATLVQLLAKWRGPAAKALGREGLEATAGAMVAAQVLQIEVFFTAFSVNAYLAAGPHAAALEAGRLRVALPAAPPPPRAVACGCGGGGCRAGGGRRGPGRRRRGGGERQLL